MPIMQKIKQLLYFPVANYFRFFAQIQLALWKPKIIVLTGSSGKTTLLHLIQSQLKGDARYSHHANSAFGIPFNILGLERKTLKKGEWLYLFISAPFKAFKKPFKERIYVVEADCDRLNEGRFLASLLNPEVTCWISSTKTHSVNFPPPIEESIAYEFGYFLEYTSKLVIINEDSALIKKQIQRTKAAVKTISKANLKYYQVSEDSTQFKINSQTYSFRFLLPKETSYQIEAMMKILSYLNISADLSFKDFSLPPGRCSQFSGIKKTTILDSSYNADLGSMKVMLNIFDQISHKKKWVVLGDMVEQGKQEKEEHQQLAELLNSVKLEKIILVGPRLSEYTLPELRDAKVVESFITPLETLKYLQANIVGEEFILFKGARFLEGIIEHLLQNKSDVKNLCRREKVWQERRQKWGL